MFFVTLYKRHSKQIFDFELCMIGQSQACHTFIEQGWRQRLFISVTLCKMIISKLCFYPLMHVLVFVTLALSGVRKMKLTVVFSCQKKKRGGGESRVDSHCSTKWDNTQNNANIVARPQQEAGSYSTNKQYRKINHLAFSWQVSPRSEGDQTVFIYIYTDKITVSCIDMIINIGVFFDFG